MEKGEGVENGGDRFMGRLNWLRKTRLLAARQSIDHFLSFEEGQEPFLPNFKAIGPHLIVQVEKMAPGFVVTF